ncbi:MAG: hypothetical protein OXE59_04625 [Bacteroidetes bacterium]|nr:hypothetical protein [Bacteroidota bacterium]
MILLIDYDNLGKLRRRSLSQIIQILLDQIPQQNYTPTDIELNCRLYGGWLDKRNKYTKLAQNLFTEIKQNFPCEIKIFNHSRKVDAPELATSLACDSGNDFPYTYRARSVPPGIRAKRFPPRRCISKDHCSISEVNIFWNDGKCSNSKCPVGLSETFFRPEQKLVDSMIVVDLIHFATIHKEHVVLVSGDDDMWPGIRYALLSDTSGIG